MKKVQEDFFNIITDFRRLNITSMLPHINHGDFALLKNIHSQMEKAGDDMVKVSALVRAMGIPPPAISRGLKSLEGKGYVERTVDAEDRRNTYVSLTDAGRALMEEVERIMDDFCDAVFANLGDDTMEKLNDYLRRFVETSKEEITRRKYQD